MANFVIKKNGSKEPFDGEKIRASIRVAAQEANIPEERITELVQQIGSTAISIADTKEEIATSEIKAKILTDLDSIEPSVSASWRTHEQQKAGI